MIPNRGPQRAGESPIAPATLSSQLGLLLSRKVECKPLATAPPALGPRVFAVLRDDSGQAAWLAFSLPLAASTAAALSLLPPGVAADAARTGKLDGALEENFHEIVNVLTTLLRARLPHARIEQIHAAGSREAVTMAGRVPTKAERADLDVSVTGYAGGPLTIVLLPAAA